ncbi:MAG: ribosome-associated translation inhibitor RaiA [Desulfobacteraceae bacterium]|jgi:putative sigma-54 modulation protein|nr:ribosome-associated translation inhibitor RaiA [Desulfobacteraceae bacterium]
MQTAVTFQNIDSSPQLRDYVQSKLDRLDKLLDKPGTADVTLRVEKMRRIAEVNLSSQWLSVRASEETDDMQAAIDLVVDKLKRQITRKKEKVRTLRVKS